MTITVTNHDNGRTMVERGMPSQYLTWLMEYLSAYGTDHLTVSVQPDRTKDDLIDDIFGYWMAIDCIDGLTLAGLRASLKRMDLSELETLRDTIYTVETT